MAQKRTQIILTKKGQRRKMTKGATANAIVDEPDLLRSRRLCQADRCKRGAEGPLQRYVCALDGLLPHLCALLCRLRLRKKAATKSPGGGCGSAQACCSRMSIRFDDNGHHGSRRESQVFASGASRKQRSGQVQRSHRCRS